LHAAAAAANPTLVLELLGMGCDVNSKDIKGVTPLLALFRSPENEKWRIQKVMKMLMKAGADINARDSINGMSVSHLIAALHGIRFFSKYAKKYNMDINARY
jgi:ankyrin repeat protein